MRKTLVVALVGALAAGAMVGGATIAMAQGDVIAQRKDNRKQTAAAMRAIKAIVDAKGPTAGAVEQAAKLKTLEASFLKMFPAGSDKGDTRALPAVWTDWAGFEAASKAANVAYDKLAVEPGRAMPRRSRQPLPTPARPAAPATRSSRRRPTSLTAPTDMKGGGLPPPFLCLRPLPVTNPVR